MTLYYSIVFGLLVTEMAAFLLLVAPLPTQFRKKIILLFKDAPIMAQVFLTLRFTFFFILILFVDSVNRVYRVQQEIHAGQESGISGQNLLNSDRSEIQARRFYAQRNMYLCGFTLFLSYILSATYTLVLDLANAEEALKASGKSGAVTESKEIKELKETIRKKDVDLDALKRQYKGLTTEYDRVADDLNEKSGVVPGNKKTD